MKKHLSILCALLLTVTLFSCGGDDDDFQTVRKSQTIRTCDVIPLAQGIGGTSSNTFVATISQGAIQPHHVGTAIIEAVALKTKYIYTVQVLPEMNLFTDLGECIKRGQKDIEKILGEPLSKNGYKYSYPTPKLEEQIMIQYSRDYVMEYAMITFDRLFSSKVTEQVEDYYAFYKFDGTYSVYINANTLDEATVLLVRSQTDTTDRIIYMTPALYELVGDLTNLFVFDELPKVVM